MHLPDTWVLLVFMVALGGDTASSRSSARLLSWSRTVERESVHRVSVAEVLLTDVVRVAGTTFLAAAQWPCSHPTFRPTDDGGHSRLMVLETLRQLGIFIPAQFYAVPPEAHFLIKDLFYGVDASAEPRSTGGASDITCLAQVDDFRPTHDGRGLRGLRLRLRLSVGATTFARAGGNARFLDPDTYAALRRGAAGARPAAPRVRPTPEAVDATLPRDVLVAESDGGVLEVDPADRLHPFFFDHPCDHMPGMVLVEAARQAIALVSDGELLRPTAFRLRTPRFTEFDPPARIECTLHRGRQASFRVRQGGAYTALGAARYR
ncbi:ScbA/BarX family gamma-butyrolactone biosynthesis protein [Embleya sp. NPDC020630]|uniref:ScbA/BarX family gamma-butyrolactone biosynthesis protein n=1 Tax=Embleya sp. NPDC020630 TaxID=3363979 RepID=UPI0037AF6782